jgi:hypothetical protein
MAKPHLTINIHLKYEGQEGKTGPVQGWRPVCGGKINTENEGELIWSMNTTMYACIQCIRAWK